MSRGHASLDERRLRRLLDVGRAGVSELDREALLREILEVHREETYRAIRCPWHGSRFDLRTGAVLEGPAVFVQPRLEARVRDDRIEVGFPAAAGGELPELANLQAPPNPS